MQILGWVCLLALICSVLKCYKRRALQIFVGFWGMECASCLKFLSQGPDFGFGFLLFGRFSPLSNLLGLALAFVLGLKVLQFGCPSKCLMEFLCGFRGKSEELRNGFCSKCGFGEVCGPKVESLESSHSPNGDCLVLSKGIEAKAAAEEKEFDGDDSDGERDCYNEDEEFDVLALRKLVKIERRMMNEARTDLEKERMASASAAEEAMAMILRLQNEKSSIEIQSNQYRRMAEQKQQYDEVTIQSLQWVVRKHESERIHLQDELRLCKQKLLKGGERDLSEEGDSSANLFSSTMEDDMDDVFEIDPWT